MLIYVAFADVGRLFRDGAHVKQTMNLTNTVFDENRLIGRWFSDEALQGDMKRLTFKVISPEGKAKFKINFRSTTNPSLPRPHLWCY